MQSHLTQSERERRSGGELKGRVLLDGRKGELAGGDVGRGEVEAVNEGIHHARQQRQQIQHSKDVLQLTPLLCFGEEEGRGKGEGRAL